jgi:hypothetical protein
MIKRKPLETTEILQLKQIQEEREQAAKKRKMFEFTKSKVGIEFN